jgi:hypothetical protein
MKSYWKIFLLALFALLVTASSILWAKYDASDDWPVILFPLYVVDLPRNLFWDFSNLKHSQWTPLLGIPYSSFVFSPILVICYWENLRDSTWGLVLRAIWLVIYLFFILFLCISLIFLPRLIPLMPVVHDPAVKVSSKSNSIL